MVPHDPRAPKQARSAWTRQRLLDVLSELLEDQPLHEVAVAEIAARAGVTVGAIYGRFGGKTEMAIAGFERFADDAIARMESWASDAQRGSEAPREIVRSWVAGASAFGRRRSPMGRLSTTIEHPRIAAAEQRIVECAVRSLASLLSSHVEGSATDLERRLGFAVTAAQGVMGRRELIPRTGRLGFSDDALIEASTDMILSSVGLDVGRSDGVLR